MDRPLYRRFLIGIGLLAAIAVAIQGGRFILRGQGFYGFLSMCMVAFIVLVIHGYTQEAE